MTTTLAQVVTGIQDLVRTVPGVQYAPDKVPDASAHSVNVFCYPISGGIVANGAGFATELHNIKVRLMVSAGTFSSAAEEALSLLDPIIRKLLTDPTLGGTVQTYAGITYTYDDIGDFGAVSYVQYSITLEGVKIQNSW